MHLGADQFPDNTILLDFDICIVGAGAAGWAMAKRLTGSSVKVWVLSSGSATDGGRPIAHRQAIYKGAPEGSPNSTKL
jgi:choline dehydrogenase-like flavoprotein